MYPFQGRVRVVLVVISLRSGSSVALLGAKTRGEARNPAESLAIAASTFCSRRAHLAHFL
jgi:hypothetical protein